MADEVVLAFSTFPNVETARRIARDLVAENFAACANVIPKVESIYRWQGKLETGEEALAIFKLSASRYREFEIRLRSVHPYDVPEIISCKIDSGLPEYLRWVTENCDENSTA
jgi:periplasmic divalent cation tolerance protein